MSILNREQLKIQQWQDNLKVESNYRNNFYEFILFFLAKISKYEAFDCLEIKLEALGYVFVIDIKEYGKDTCETFYIRQWRSSNAFITEKDQILQAIDTHSNEIEKERKNISLRETALSKLSQEEINVLALS